MCFEWLSFDLWSRWVAIYDHDQPIRYVFWVVELRSRSTKSLYVSSCWATIYDPCQPFSMSLEWSSYDLRCRSNNIICVRVVKLRSTTSSTNTLCALSGWATIYATDQPILYDGWTTISGPGQPTTFSNGWATIYDLRASFTHLTCWACVKIDFQGQKFNWIVDL